MAETSKSLQSTTSADPSKALSFREVLECELDEVTAARERRLGASASPPAAGPATVSTPGDVYTRAHEARLVGLAFSGGGIRSATFNLGVLQGLARLKLLPRFDYLSTVSGGGYIGSWLAAWIGRATDDGARKAEQTALDRVQKALVHDPALGGHAKEPHEIRFLREYSNYLTPRTGLFGADTWSAISTYLRNMLLNMTIVVAALSAFLMLPRLLMWLFWVCVHNGPPSCCFWVAVVALLLAVGFVGLNLSADGDPSARQPLYTQQGVIQCVVVLPAFVAAWCGTCWLWAGNIAPPFADTVTRWLSPTASGRLIWAAYTGLAYTALWFWGWVVAAVGKRRRDGTEVNERIQIVSWIAIVVSALGAGSFGGLLLYQFSELLSGWHQHAGTEWLALVWGTPILLIVFTLTVVLHIGLIGRSLSDANREWWARLGGWLLIYMGGWAGLFGCAIYAPWLVAYVVARNWGAWIVSGSTLGWLASTVGGLLAGRSSATDGRVSNRTLDLIATAGPPVFAVGLLVALSTGIQVMLARLAHRPEVGWADLYFDHWKLMWETTSNWYVVTLPFYSSVNIWVSVNVFVFVCCLAVALLLSWRVDINQFSLHLLYRNRLTRCYLGASTRQRHPNLFTGFDPKDDLPLADFASAQARRLKEDYCGPYPIINVALNLVGGDELAWQQRKAASFVFTPQYSGFELPRWSQNSTTGSGPKLLGYRPTAECGDKDAKGGISLGTAFAISGAAVSPNWGYHSSPPLAFLMTVFNVRLGWWLGNPTNRRAWRKPGPEVGLYYLSKELLGYTNEKSRFVYLSDGGHFENLGIYELVRRRCRFIVACDAGQDGELTFEDLGNAIRKCRADFGIDIDIDVDPIRKQAGSGRSLWHCAVGTIHYENADDGASPGTLVYVKPSLTGGEPADVLNYASSDPAFPHQTTADQWFDESQFESYRALGDHIAQTTFEAAANSAQVAAASVDFSTEALFVALKQRWYPPSPAVQQFFTKHAKTLDGLMQTLRTDATLRFLDAQIYPEWDELMAGAKPQPSTQLWLPPEYEQLRAGFYFCLSLIQLMEDVYLDLDLEREYEHPDNRGWMNLFRHWSWSGMLRVTWAMTASTFGGRFQSFCERRLRLTLGRVIVRNIGGGDQIDRILASARELNFVEVKRIKDLLSDPANFPSGKPDIVILQIDVPDPSSASSKTFTFGFALVSNEHLVYLRVQDHLRNMGLGRQALQAMRGSIIKHGVPSGDAKVLVDKGRVDKQAYDDFVALLDSVWNER